jgi:hypothetical protein
MDNREAQSMLRHNRVAAYVEDGRSYLEIAAGLGLLTTRPEPTPLPAPMMSESARLQVLNMTQYVHQPGAVRSGRKHKCAVY